MDRQFSYSLLSVEFLPNLLKYKKSFNGAKVLYMLDLLSRLLSVQGESMKFLGLSSAAPPSTLDFRQKLDMLQKLDRELALHTWEVVKLLSWWI